MKKNIITTVDLIKDLAEKHGVNVYDIKLQLSPEGYILIWNHVEGGVKEEDLWEPLDTHKIENLQQNNESKLELLQFIDSLIREIKHPEQTEVLDIALNKAIEGCSDDLEVMDVYKILKHKLSAKKLDLMDRN